jgi:hypothetical protein
MARVTRMQRASRARESLQRNQYRECRLLDIHSLLPGGWDIDDQLSSGQGRVPHASPTQWKMIDPDDGTQREGHCCGALHRVTIVSVWASFL